MQSARLSEVKMSFSPLKKKKKVGQGFVHDSSISARQSCAYTFLWFHFFVDVFNKHQIVLLLLFFLFFFFFIRVWAFIFKSSDNDGRRWAFALLTCVSVKTLPQNRNIRPSSFKVLPFFALKCCLGKHQRERSLSALSVRHLLHPTTRRAVAIGTAQCARLLVRAEKTRRRVRVRE